MRAYELMVIIDGDLDEEAAAGQIDRIATQIVAEGGTVATTDQWGKRRFAYPIDHKHDGTYVVFEIVTESGGLPDLERMLRIADEIVRHKLLRLPDHEAGRRGLLGAATPADAG